MYALLYIIMFLERIRIFVSQNIESRLYFLVFTENVKNHLIFKTDFSYFHALCIKFSYYSEIQKKAYN